MKQIRPREASPLYVWLALALIGFGVFAYLVGYLMIEEILDFIK